MMSKLKADDIAQALNVPTSWVYGESRKKGNGTIPKLKIGKYVRFDLEEVLSWLKEKQSKSI
jgi:predicted DNA-binding transcriptional regulator AlpA